MRKKTLTNIANIHAAREGAGQQLLKHFLEGSSAVTPKNGGETRLVVVLSYELAHAICDEFGWSHDIVSSSSSKTVGESEESTSVPHQQGQGD